MLSHLPTIKKIALAGRRVLVRSDFNVDIDPHTNTIIDDTRIRLGLRTYQYLLAEGAVVVGMTHVGRPDGKFVAELSTKPIAKQLASLLHHPVTHLPDCVGLPLAQQIGRAKPGTIFFLENTRFHRADEENNPVFAKDLAKMGDLFVNDALGVSHRAHASVVGVTEYLPAVAGFSLLAEVDHLEKFLAHITQPYVVILGGAKLDDKVALIKKLLPVADKVLLGSALAVALWKVQDREVGSKSLYDADTYEAATQVLALADEYPDTLVLPTDVQVGPSAQSRKTSTASAGNIPQELGVFDIGPATMRNYGKIIAEARTILFNGPMGYFENPHFAVGTEAVFSAIAQSRARALAGGGETIMALNRFGLRKKITYISEGGGAMLEYLEGKELPGLKALQNND